MKKNIFFLATLLMVLGCSSQKGDPFSHIEVSEFSEATQVFNEVYGSIFVKNIDSYFIVSTIQEDKLFHVFSDDSLLVSFGKIGRGPNEIPYPMHIYEHYENSLFLYNSQIFTWNEVFLKESIKLSKLIFEDQYEFPRELSSARDVFNLNDESLIAVYDDHFNRFLDGERGIFIHNKTTNDTEFFDLENFRITPYEVMPATNINAKNASLSPDRSKLAIASVYAPLLEIFDVEKREVKKINLHHDEHETSFNLDEFKSRELTRYYLYTYTTENNIYLLYSGKDEINSDQEMEIHVLTWDGMPVKKYRVPNEYSLSSFLVDETKGIITGHSIDNDAIYRFYYGGSDER